MIDLGLYRERVLSQWRIAHSYRRMSQSLPRKLNQTALEKRRANLSRVGDPSLWNEHGFKDGWQTALASYLSAIRSMEDRVPIPPAEQGLLRTIIGPRWRSLDAIQALLPELRGKGRLVGRR